MRRPGGKDERDALPIDVEAARKQRPRKHLAAQIDLVTQPLEGRETNALVRRIVHRQQGAEGLASMPGSRPREYDAGGGDGVDSRG